MQQDELKKGTKIKTTLTTLTTLIGLANKLNIGDLNIQ
tara:strand:+ start:857 stop:970 length:114 start_codon:yes stop_codon:yes gene_type:complete